MKKFKDLKIQAKLLIWVFLILIILSLTLLSTGIFFSQRSETTRILDHNKSTQDTVNIIFDNEKRTLSTNLDIITSRDTLKQQFAARDRNALYQNANTFFDGLNKNADITHLYFIDPDGRVFLRVHDPKTFGDIITRGTFKEVQKTQSKVTGIELGKTGFALRMVTPLFYQGKLLGYVEIGEEINNSINMISEKTGDQYEALGLKSYLVEKDWTTLANKLSIDEKWDAFDNYGTVAETKDTEQVDACLRKDLKFGDQPTVNYKTANFEDKFYTCNSIPLKTLGDKTIGTLVYTNDITSSRKVAVNSYVNILVVCAAIFSIFSILSYLYFKRYLVRPIKNLNHTVSSITKSGDLNVPIKADSKDEIGELAQSFGGMKNKLQRSQEEMEQRIEERTRDLKSTNEAMIGRELKMIELKKEITNLKDQKRKKTNED